jgi:hypothetical protein
MLKSGKNRWSARSNSEKNARMEALAPPHQAMYLRVQVRILCIGTAQTAGHSSTLKCQMPTDKTRRLRACSAHQVCIAWAVDKVAMASSRRPSSKSPKWATSNNQIKTLTMAVDSRIVQALRSHPNKSFQAITLCHLPLMPSLHH